MGKNLPLSESRGWMLTLSERESRYWVTAQAGVKDETLFSQGTESTWQWAQGATSIRWFTDGERRYGKVLWPLASEYLRERGLAMTYPSRIPQTAEPLCQDDRRITAKFGGPALDP